MSYCVVWRENVDGTWEEQAEFDGWREANDYISEQPDGGNYCVVYVAEGGEDD